MKLELVILKTCPFVQRNVITLNYKQLAFESTYIELDDPPQWFLDISPMGKVPVLKIDDRHVLFESAVINEYLDDVTDGSLQPDEPLKRAQNRAWIEFGSNCIMEQYLLGMKKDEQEYAAHVRRLQKKLDILENRLGDSPSFNGGNFSLVDAAYAPLLMRYRILNRITKLVPPERFPKITTWSDTLLQMEAIRNSVVNEFDDLYYSMLRKQDGHLATLLVPFPQ